MTTTTRNVLIAVGAVVVVAALAWYFAVYDTAQGKCNRGDVGACLVLAAQQAQQSADAAASQSVAAAMASREAKQSASALASARASVAAVDAQQYSARCAALGGQIQFGGCQVQYSAGSNGTYWWPVPLASDGSWNQTQVAKNKQDCAKGQVLGQGPVAWHPDTNVCAWTSS